MFNRICLREIDQIPLYPGDDVFEDFRPFVTKNHTESLHGIDKSGIYLKAKSYNPLVLRFVEAFLQEDEYDFRTACEVKTRIYVRENTGVWHSVPKREFWRKQCEMLWTLWGNYVKAVKPDGEWGEYVVRMIEQRRDDGVYKYNPLVSSRSRRKLRELYKLYVFNSDLYQAEKRRPGPKPKERLIQYQTATGLEALECQTSNVRALVV